MSRVIDTSKPLSDEDRQYMLDRGLEQQVQRIDAQHNGEDVPEALPAGAGDVLPQPASPTAEQPPVPGAVTDPTVAGAEAAAAFNGSQGDGGPTAEDYADYKVDDLKNILRDRNLPVSGTKDELIARILNDGDD